MAPDIDQTGREMTPLDVMDDALNVLDTVAGITGALGIALMCGSIPKIEGEWLEWLAHQT